MRIVVSAEFDGTIFELPPAGLNPMATVSLITGIVFSVGAAVSMLNPESFSPWWLAFIPLFFFATLVIGIPLGVLLKGLYARQQLVVSPRALVVSYRGLLRTRRHELPSEELEELAISHSMDNIDGATPVWVRLTSKMLARSDRRSLAFGEGLNRFELQWLERAIGAALCGLQPPSSFGVCAGPGP
jgi:hypothetical protein